MPKEAQYKATKSILIAKLQGVLVSNAISETSLIIQNIEEMIFDGQNGYVDRWVEQNSLRWLSRYYNTARFKSFVGN